ncbi:MAG: PIG-L deacetylase family protein [Spirochaetota bacterium]
MKEENNRVLAIGAHPDDIEFMCSGTLKLLKDRGYEVHLAVVANGDCGTAVESQEGITRTRRQEALNAAKLLEAPFYPLGELDLRVSFDDRTKMKVTECVRKVDPVVVFAHPHQDYMSDHEAASFLARFACFAAPIPNYYTYSVMPEKRTSHIPYLYYWAPLEGKDIYGKVVPQNVYVNVSEVMEFKENMLGCHKSQRDWLMKQHGMDTYTENMKNTARVYSEWCGFEFAEGFRQHLGNAYPQKNFLREALGELAKEQNR